MATAAAAIVAQAKREIVSHLMSANAVSPDQAVAYAPGRRIQRRMLDRFCRAGVVVETAPGEYYLNVPAYDAQRRTMRKRAAAVVGGLLAIGAVIAAFA